MLQKPYDNRVDLVCIDSYNDGIPTGRVYHPQLGTCDHFRGLTQFLVQMEESLKSQPGTTRFGCAFRSADNICDSNFVSTKRQLAGVGDLVEGK